ncbi:MAG: twin-arginine translocase TatA/TatE family subunit [Actinomycetaceae bacterium]|nr:twin-arginine translocase TatA/TatE family subunit [Actinomycetaceae bacterium]
MFPVSGLQLLVILFVAAVVVGPSRLPAVASTISRWVKASRRELAKLRATLDDEVGDELKDFDFSKLDVRQYDPRRMIREAVQEELDEWKELIRPLGTPSDTPATEQSVTADTFAAGASDHCDGTAISAQRRSTLSAARQPAARRVSHWWVSQQPTSRAATKRMRTARHRNSCHGQRRAEDDSASCARNPG